MRPVSVMGEWLLMRCTLNLVLSQPLFKQARVLTGARNLDRGIFRSSVFDCPLKESMLASDILSKGDLFLSGLDQFREDSSHFIDFINALIDHQCSGLIITDENLQLITPDIAAYCDRCGFPVIAVDRNISYADMMNTINSLIVSQYYHALNDGKIKKLRSPETGSMERLRVLDSIRPGFARFMLMVCVRGAENSMMTDTDLFARFAERERDCFLMRDHIFYFLFSADTENALKKSAAAFTATLDNYFSSYSSGISGILPKTDIHRLFAQCELAMETAEVSGQKLVYYDAGSLLQLLSGFKDSDTLYDFYQALCARLSEYKSDDGSALMDTLRCYVNSGGSYHVAAQKLGQREATIRYRINRVRQLLDLEEDIVKFHAVSSILVAIDGFTRNT